MEQQRIVPRIEDVFGNLPSLETKRLILRKMTIDDAQDMFEYARDPEVATYTTWYAHRSIDDTREFLRLVLEQYEKGQVSSWGVVHKAENKFIGTCGYIEWNVYHRWSEIGYALSKKYWGQGYTTEAARESSGGFRLPNDDAQPRAG
jgi:ribosomal-protein-alanine N-acetyltransferase